MFPAELCATPRVLTRHHLEEERSVQLQVASFVPKKRGSRFVPKNEYISEKLRVQPENANLEKEKHLKQKHRWSHIKKLSPQVKMWLQILKITFCLGLEQKTFSYPEKMDEHGEFVARSTLISGC